MNIVLNSKATKEIVKKLRPSSIVLLINIFGLPFIIKNLFSDVGGYSAMVWIWYIIAIITSCVAIWAYTVDIAAFTKSDIYKKLVSEKEKSEAKL